MKNINMDNTILFTIPAISCDFDKKYKEHICNKMKKTKIMRNNNLMISLSNDLYYDANNSFHSYDIYGKYLNEESYISILKKYKA